MTIKHITLFVLFAIFALQTSAQTNWKDIENQIYAKKNLTDIYNTIEGLQRDAIQKKEYLTIARCYQYLILIKDLKTEDTLFFKNSYCLDSILEDKNTAPILLSATHVLKAKRMVEYTKTIFHKSHKFLYDYAIKYSKLKKDQLDSIIRYHFNKAMELSIKSENVKTEDALWLSTTLLSFLYKPTYTDILYAEMINTYDALTNNAKSNYINDILKYTPTKFIITAENMVGVDESLKTQMNIFYKWANYNKANLAKFYFIETLARKYFYANIKESDEAKKLYEDYLIFNATSNFTEVKANCVYQLCLYWNSLGLKYNNIDNDYYYARNNENKYLPKYRPYFEKAITLFTKNENMLDSFMYLKNILLNMKAQISAKKIDIVTAEKIQPHKNIAMAVTFKNAKFIYLKIIKIPANAIVNNTKIFTTHLQSIEGGMLKTISLPFTEDYQTHKANITIEGLPVGHYAIIYADTIITAYTNIANNYTILNVTNLAVIQNGNRVFILDRKTGMPIKNTILQTSYRPTKTSTATISKPIKINTQGWLDFSSKRIDTIVVANGIDTVIESFSIRKHDLPNEIYDKEIDDDLLDYYNGKIKMQIYMDRAIYRPGQTLHYKAVFLVPHPYTGEMLMLNKENLQFTWAQKIFNKEIKKFLNEKMRIYIRDPFRKILDTIDARPNAFGSISGSYTISKNAALGEWEFDADGIDMYNYRTGAFKVEEYKRPQYELTVENPTTYLQLGDSFVVRAKVKSFAGAALNNVTVGYTVTASGSLPSYDSLQKKYIGKYESVEILDIDTITNNEGYVDIKINDSRLAKYNFVNNEQWSVNYTVNVETTDQSGETHEEKNTISLSNRPVRISYNLDNILDRNNLPAIFISTKNNYAGDIQKTVKINVYKEEEIVEKNELTDDYLYDYKWINNGWVYTVTNIEKNISIQAAEIIYTTTLTTKNGEILNLPKELLPSGKYSIEVLCEENGKLLGKTKRQFQVFDKSENIFAENRKSFYYTKQNTAEAGQKINWIWGNNNSNNIYSIHHAQYFVKKKKGVTLKNEYTFKNEKYGINDWEFTMPTNAIDEVKLTHIYIVNNEVKKEEKTIYVTKKSTEEPEIIIEQYRRKLTPGAKETFVATIKTKNENIVTELMTTMYDASLDKIEKHEWEIPKSNVRFRLESDWDININNTESANLFNNTYKSYGYVEGTQPLYWLNPIDYAYSEITKGTYTKQGEMYLYSKVAGLNVIYAEGLQDVVVTVGYSSTSKKSMELSSVVIRGVSSLSKANVAFVIVDGVQYEGDVNKINSSTITDAIILKGADATALYGSKAASGVLILSTKGKVILPKPEEAPTVVRKNFSETAFFYPAIYADADGFYNIEFTMPESVTEWKWKLLAHTKKAQFIYAERNIVTQLPLMVQPNMPRFLYQGDKIVLQTRITNLDTLDISGKMKCVIEDEVTGENITNALININEKPFLVSKKSNENRAIEITIPENLLHPIKIKITARAGNFSDGEEHVIPILSKKILVTQNIPFALLGNKDTSIATPALPTDAVPYGIGMYIAPKPQAAIINALPYMAFYTYKCAEQTFNKILAHCIANKIMQTDSNVNKMAVAVTQKSIPEKTTTMPDELSEETMPWLQLGNANALHQKNLAKLFDTTNGNTLIQKYINDLKDLQNADGGITWFKGGSSSKYISNYILAGFSKLNTQQFCTINTNVVKELFVKLIPFCDANFLDTINYVSDDVAYIYARALVQNNFPIPTINKIRIEYILNKAWKNVDTYSLNNQAQLIKSTLVYATKSSELYNLATAQLASIQQLAITDNTNGVRWKDVADTDDLNNNAEETVANIATAFEQVGQNKPTIDGIIKWLINTKQNHNWSTTKATAEVVGLMYRNKPTVLDLPITLNSGNNITVTDNLLAGNLFSFNNYKVFPSSVYIKKDNAAACNAGLNFYYFSAIPPINIDDKVLNISKQLFVFSNNNWEAINSNTILHIADKIQTVITIHAPKQLKYVFIDEKRAATLEPIDATSGYQYNSTFSYYQSVRDVGYQFFAEQISSGISTITYETVVAKEGTFCAGTTTLQCMYKPEVKAYAAGLRIEVK